MTPKTDAVVLACLAFALVGGLVIFSCLRDAAAHRGFQPAITVPLHP